ncbi:MAG: hypothetical protein SNJ78_11110, partial [Spirochaetales bacterium]
SWKTGWTAFLYATVAFLVPFVLVYKPGLLLVGSLPALLEVLLITVLGTFFLVAAVSGFLIRNLTNIWIRVFLFCFAVLTIVPERSSTLLGVAGGPTVTIIEYLSYRKKNK